MAQHRSTTQPSLRRRIEQTLAANPAGLDWRQLADELARRAVAAHLPVPERSDVVRELGLLIVERRVDEIQCRFVLRTMADRWGRAAA